MCGIAGIVKFEGFVSEQELRSMTDVIAHRGPDGEGFWTSEKRNAGLAHRRLSIIDLSADGKQPMHSVDERYTITFNGEIYNYIELKEQLIREGCKFHTATDTEVILALYDLKKEKCLQDLDGMFAFAIWDEKEKQLFCARDRFGEKPFHYYKDEKQFVFASELKQFWPHGIRKKMSDQRLNAFIKTGQIDNPSDISETFYEGIKRLDASHYMLVKTDGRTEIKRYWQIDPAVIYTGSFESATEEFLRLFTKSVSIRLRSDVPVGTSLSGGLDSSSIVMIIDKLKGKEQQQTSFSARFKDFDKDEGTHIDAVVNACKNIQSNEAWPDTNYFFDNFKSICHHQDEPFGSTSIVAQYAVMELAKQKGVTVLIDGQGADEYLAGYLPYYKLYLNQLFYTDKALYAKEYAAYNLLHGKTRKFVGPDENETLRMKLGRLKGSLLNAPKPYPAGSLQKQLVADTTSSGLKALLRYADRNSMAHSREVRLPFLSHELVEFVFSLPDDFKLRLGWTKYILRKSMESMLPASICWRSDKVGYASPQQKWMNSQAAQEEIRKAVKNLDLDTKSITDTEALNWRALVAQQYY
ncbi:MAG: asparagine synthase (glutamine-hydrolyzing) [Bacteroidetes bacterium]|jgi:asparagine synthase (glutamine-hydrolysing)|nr:asparagine synthase (glutamine-hydrolyzing) [Bacteroidota bacterium]